MDCVYSTLDLTSLELESLCEMFRLVGADWLGKNTTLSYRPLAESLIEKVWAMGEKA